MTDEPTTPPEVEAEEEEYSVAERIVIRDELISTNDEKIKLISDTYGMSVARNEQAALKLEHMIDYIFPPSTPLRLEYDIDFEQFFSERLEAIRAHLSKQKRKQGLVLPGRPNGLIKP